MPPSKKRCILLCTCRSVGLSVCRPRLVRVITQQCLDLWSFVLIQSWESYKENENFIHFKQFILFPKLFQQISAADMSKSVGMYIREQVKMTAKRRFQWRNHWNEHKPISINQPGRIQNKITMWSVTGL